MRQPFDFIMSQQITIQLDKERHLKYGMKALMLIEELTDKPMAKFNLESVTMKDVCILIYAGLIHEDNTLTLDETIQIIDDHGFGRFNELVEKMSKAMNISFGTKNA